jgi:hypothetical protein
MVVMFVFLFITRFSSKKLCLKGVLIVTHRKKSNTHPNLTKNQSKTHKIDFFLSAFKQVLLYLKKKIRVLTHFFGWCVLSIFKVRESHFLVRQNFYPYLKVSLNLIN